MTANPKHWLTLVSTLSAHNTAVRMRLWRALKALGGAPVAQAVGSAAVLVGLCAHTPHDDQRLAQAARVFDNLYRHYQKRPP